MVETLMLQDSENKTIRIAGEKKPVSVVKSVFLNLDMSHIRYVLESLNNTTSHITNIKSYLLTALYNAPMPINNYYQAKVNHDFSADQEKIFDNCSRDFSGCSNCIFSCSTFFVS